MLRSDGSKVVSGWVRSGWTWWIQELTEVKSAFSAFLMPGKSAVVFAFDGDQVSIFDAAHRGQIFKTNQLLSVFSIASLADPQSKNLVSKILSRRKRTHDVGLRIAKRDCFEMETTHPKASKAHLDRILALEICRTTPFELCDIYASFHVKDVKGDPNTVEALTILAKKEGIDEKRALMGELGAPPNFIEVWQGEIANALPIDLLSRRINVSNQLEPQRRIYIPTIAFSALLWLAALLADSRQQQALDQLDASIAIARQKASEIVNSTRSEATASTRQLALEEKKQQAVEFVDVWEDMARILPDTAWLTSVRRSNNRVQLVGFADSAAALIPMLSKSLVFHDASFSAPVTADPREKKERFEISVEIKSLQTIVTTTSGGQ